MDLKIRRACKEDVPPLVELVNRAYRGETGHQGWTTEAVFLAGQRIDCAALSEIVSDPRTQVLIAEERNKILGCVQVENRGTQGYFGMLTVAVEAQGKGVGDFLLTQAETLVRETWRLGSMTMRVIHPRPELISWYERRGYRATGETNLFPYGDERFGIPLRPDLYFLVFDKELSEPSLRPAAESRSR